MGVRVRVGVGVGVRVQPGVAAAAEAEAGQEDVACEHGDAGGEANGEAVEAVPPPRLPFQ